MGSRIPPNRKVREGRVATKGPPQQWDPPLVVLHGRRPAGVNATKSGSMLDAGTVVSGACSDTIGVGVVAMATMNAAFPGGETLRRGLRVPSCRRPQGARLSGIQMSFGNSHVSKPLPSQQGWTFPDFRLVLEEPRAVLR